ncbi:SleB-like protein [Sphingomonas sp. Leaf412]|uniref:cell wall hydrolase n=1 Tax=Sphingomonas sp. Leaf412 TaxID=1736370 RepID=UPI0006F3396F|nr:cell wall hydrolase [Sphingomonas sp. Leaf412]KQT32579.1 SleB-like protein [Sphingomonas sp. Leaf412]
MTDTTPSPSLRIILGGIAALAIVGPIVAVRNAPAIAPPAVAEVKRPQRIVAPNEVPEVEPVEYQSLAPQDARAFNATVPFARGPNPAARPFRFAGDDAAKTRATDCLAAAAWYEAGDDPVGQKAVVQVVLNRLRHPAFPKTVCGVVFQGQERRTGCQFTFTCDGAMTRPPAAPAWDRARKVATAALNGAVYRKVGYATHYHTDWVVPYWSASLDKIAEVNTHLFFRWTGWWGTPPAFRRAVSGDEPVIAKLAPLSSVHGGIAGALAAADAPVAAAVPFTGTIPEPLVEAPDTYHVVLAGIAPEMFRAMADTACGPRERCKFMGWTDRRQLPTTVLPTPAQMAAMSFSYLRNTAEGFDRALWNCAQYPRPDAKQCMKRQVMPAATPTPPALVPTRGVAELDGVRRRADPAPVATPTVP